MFSKVSHMASVSAFDRQRWLAILAQAEPADLETALKQLNPSPQFERLIGPEIGLFMTRGRIGGTGASFNLGEVSVARCTIRSSSDRIGTGYVLGRNGRHAELVAIFDAWFQEQATPFTESFLKELVQKRQRQAEQKARKAAATKVEFFTLVRGE
jgi:alpha-D-ribose 1-methylphosphonate 5-triphosphate synthase subunit PhnG